ncbi:iron ABC transporter permease [Thalassobaculum sp.]|uniref:ABC transporter permease n=1 Tax=Thalassobaculum sp. TaxID=2022740 RepID=UPI0032EA9448
MTAEADAFQGAGPAPELSAAAPIDGRRRWHVAALATAGLVAMPVLAIVWKALNPTENIWPHLASTVLPGYVLTTVLLMLGVGVGTFVIGTGTAWLVAMCRFPGRGLFQWALLLPLAMPGYLIAYVYTDLLEFAGPLQSVLREVFGWSTRRDYWFPEIRSLGGAIAMLTLVLYPYVYALARATFLEQSICVLEVSRTLGRGTWRSLRDVALPLARPAIAVGVTLALMECLNDFGTVDFFAVRTLTAGVFDVWLRMGNAGGAAQIALVMLAFVVLLIWAERRSRVRQRFHHTSSKLRPIEGIPLHGRKAWAATVACTLPVLLGFAVPATVLADYAFTSEAAQWSPDFFRHALNSLGLSAAAALVAVALATLLAYAARQRAGGIVHVAIRLASVGYAIPGAVLAIGVLIPFAAFDNAVDGFLRQTVGISTGLILSGTVAALVFAYTVRFLAVSLGAVEAGLGRITPSMEMAARTLGHGPSATLRRLHLPMIRGSLLTGGLLVFVDTMKELPATLVLRPFNFDTLATFVYQYASDERLEACAPAALAIVAAGILPVLLLARSVGAARPGRRGRDD